VANTPKTPRSAKGCVKLCVKDDHDAVTVRVWYANRYPQVKLGSLVSVWTNHSGCLCAAILPLSLTDGHQYQMANLATCQAQVRLSSLHFSRREIEAVTS
jgi:hypothetical protein